MVEKMRDIREINKNVRFRLLLIIAVAVMILTAGGIHTVNAAQSGSSSKQKLVLYQGQTKKLKLHGLSGKVQWSSSNPKVASVSTAGFVTALQPGSCRIRAVFDNKTYSCRIRVNALAFEDPATTMVRGRQQTLVINYAKAKNVSWSSSKPAVAGVENGVVRAKNPGKTVITAVWKGISIRCSITVTSISPQLLSEAYPADKQNKGKIVLAGSSSMDFWANAEQAFAPYEIINTAIGGTTVVQWLNWYKLLITRYKPSAVVLYVGSNDLSNGEGVSGQKNAENTILLLKRITKKLKKTPVFYISVNPCWTRKGAWQEIAVSNNLVRKFCQRKKNLYYIDITEDFSRADGTPDPVLFLPDQLHPSAQGYKIWARKVAKQVKKTVKKRSR